MTTFPELVDTLVSTASPVRRLRSPLQRAVIWLAFAGVVLALLSIEHGLRADLAVHLGQSLFLIGIVAAAATGIIAAVAAFMISIPDRSSWCLLLPLPTLVVWISTISYGCFFDWISIGPDGLRMGEALGCFASLLLTSVPLAIALVAMLRYAAFLRTGAVILMGSLAVGAITSTALMLIHDLDATVMILVWNLGTAAMISALGNLLGPRMFSWAASRIS
jgi:hypothetical protein